MKASRVQVLLLLSLTAVNLASRRTDGAEIPFFIDVSAATVIVCVQCSGPYLRLSALDGPYAPGTPNPINFYSAEINWLPPFGQWVCSITHGADCAGNNVDLTTAQELNICVPDFPGIDHVHHQRPRQHGEREPSQPAVPIQRRNSCYVPRGTTKVDWRGLFSVAVVADTTFDRPEVFLTEDQAVEEAKDPVPVSERGWQDAVTAVYPLKLNTLRVRGGIVTYLPGGEAPPIRLERVDFLATNIRNVESVAGQHPSPIELDCRVFKSGVLSARGRADFFAKPRPTIIADFTLQDMTLVPLASIAGQSGILIDVGTLAVAGQLAQEPTTTRLALRSAVVSKPVLEYKRRPETKDREDIQVAKDATQSMSVRIDELRVRDGTLTYQNPSELMPPIRFERTNLRLTSVEMPPPRASRPPSRVELDTALLGAGSLRVRGRADLGATPGPLGDLMFDLQGIELARFDQLTRPWG
jgi:hypothetical protein